MLCAMSPLAASRAVSGIAVPPPAGTCRMGPPNCPKIMTPVLFQEPPTGVLVKAHTGSAGPPDTPIF